MNVAPNSPLNGAGTPDDASLLGMIFRRYRGRILFTYALFVVENLIRIAQPLAIGLAVSDLLASSTRGLWLLLAQCMCQLAIGTARNLYDTRIFATVSSDLAADLVRRQRAESVGTSRVAARCMQSRHIASFFEHELPALIATAFSLFGAVVMLMWYDLLWGVACSGLLILNGLFSRSLAVHSGRLNARLHDHEEREVGVVDRRRACQVAHSIARI